MGPQETLKTAIIINFNLSKLIEQTLIIEPTSVLKTLNSYPSIGSLETLKTFLDGDFG